MARAQNEVTGYAVGLTIFAILFVIMLVLSIVFYAQLGDLKSEKEKATEKLVEFVKPDEKADQRIVTLLAERSRGSVVGQLLDENSRLKGLISGNSQATMDMIEGSELTSRNLVPGQPMLTEIDRLRAEVSAAQQKQQEAESSRADAFTRMEQAEDDRDVARQGFDDALIDLHGSLADLNAAFETHKADVESMRQTLEQQMAGMRVEARQKLAAQISESDRLESEVTRLEQDLIEQGGNQGPSIEPWRQSDGRILAFLPERDMVYINLGSFDRLTLGMTFEVYDARTGVASDESGELRGKGSIELVKIEKDTALARIVAIDRGAVIAKGDLIANVVYDPKQTFKFVVHGEYDLNSFGQPNAIDRKLVETMIDRWGGQLLDQLNTDADYLVLGAAPSLPHALSPNEIDPTKIRIFEEQLRKYNDYEEMKTQAQKLSIPILNQNRFLFLVGYYQR